MCHSARRWMARTTECGNLGRTWPWVFHPAVIASANLVHCYRCVSRWVSRISPPLVPAPAGPHAGSVSACVSARACARGVSNGSHARRKASSFVCSSINFHLNKRSRPPCLLHTQIDVKSKQPNSRWTLSTYRLCVYLGFLFSVCFKDYCWSHFFPFVFISSGLERDSRSVCASVRVYALLRSSRYALRTRCESFLSVHPHHLHTNVSDRTAAAAAVRSLGPYAITKRLYINQRMWDAVQGQG